MRKTRGKLKGISLFSGIGGLDIGISAHVRCVAYVEREPAAQEVLRRLMKRHLLDHGVILDDVCNVSKDSLPGNIKIITAGFPCQEQPLRLLCCSASFAGLPSCLYRSAME